MKSTTIDAPTHGVYPAVGAVIVCAGKGERAGLGYNKVLFPIGSKTVLELVLDVFSESDIDSIVVVVSQSDKTEIEKLTAAYSGVSVCLGGDTRTESVFNGLKALYGCDIAVIHDGARPYVTREIIDACIDSAIEYGSGIAAVRTVDTIKQSSDGRVRTLPRSELYNAQTPQAFRYDEIMSAYAAADGAYVFTDDAEAYERAGFSPRLVDGSYGNIKITTPNDLYRMLSSRTRIGSGFDVHRLVKNRPLIIGGVHIPHDKGLDGHSDADVLTHAIMDALLSAAGLPDIGVLFPDTDAVTLGISSMLLLDRVSELVTNAGYTIGNISAVIIAQEPRLAGVIKDIRATLAARLDITCDRINVSATTTEHLGFIGKCEGIAASASCLLTKKNG